MNKVGRITARALNVLVWVALIAAIAVLAVPRLFGWNLETVLTGSMEPTLPVGSIIAVQPVEPSVVKAGDVITFATGGNPPLTTHRVVAVNPDSTFTTKGDANEEADIAPVDDGRLVGRVSFYIPLAGYAADALKRPLGWGMAMAIVVLVWALGELMSGNKSKTENDTDEAEQLVEQVAA